MANKNNDTNKVAPATQPEQLIQTPEEMIEAVLVERFGESKVREWKALSAPRKLNVITVEDKVAVLRPITASVIATFSMMAADSARGMDKASKFVMEELWIEGDRCLLDDEDYFIAAMMQVQNTIEVKKSAFYRL